METFFSGIDFTIAIRLVTSVLLGFVIGLEREMTNKYAGLRTNILVCLGACIFTLISIYGFPMELSETNGVRDTARVAAQIVTGIGFIGGGTVLRHGATVLGLTTAATLWISASIGMACGAGMFTTAIVGTVLSILILISVKFFERDFLPFSRKNYHKIKANICVENEQVDAVYDYIIECYPDLVEITKKPDKNNHDLTKVSVIIDVNTKAPIPAMYKRFQSVDGILSISIQECID
ncbi:MAG: MgtC/SapB family protein [Candidatus Gastranaerophilales bacterium]